MVRLAQPLRLFGDGLFYTEVGVGTPAQRVAVTVDTGSGNLWLPSANCTAVAPICGEGKIVSGVRSYEKHGLPLSHD